jgi:hypothetical protein
MRILVTGSRDWDDWPLINRELAELESSHPGEVLTLVHGACPTGADCWARLAATRLGWAIVAHEARWDLHGRSAGIIRNVQMVDAGADLCLAFIKDYSPGATHCATYAGSKGIPVRIYRA